jgi:hypothetical protein
MGSDLVGMDAPARSVPPRLFLPTGGSPPLLYQHQHVPHTLHKYKQGVSELHALTSVLCFATKTGDILLVTVLLQSFTA